MSLLDWGSHELLVDNSILLMEVLYSARSGRAAQPGLIAEPDADARALRKSLRLLLGTLDDTNDAHLLSELFESLRAQVLEAGLDPPPRLPAGK